MPSKFAGVLDSEFSFAFKVGNTKGESSKKRIRVSDVKSHSKDKSDKSDMKDYRLLHLYFLVDNFSELFDTGKYDKDKLNKEFSENMSEERKQVLSDVYDIDMNVMCEIANLLIDHNVVLD